MQTKEWTFRQERQRPGDENEELEALANGRDPWPEGPWMDEPDKVQWQDEATGLACLAVRGPLGSWCGYVGVGKAHPLHGIGYGDCINRCGKTKTFGELTEEVRSLAEPDSPLRNLPEPSERMAADIIKDCDHTSPDSIFDAHGGLTYSNFCVEDDQEHGICHIVDSGEEEPLWWFGFDTAHFMDLVPGRISMDKKLYGYSTMEDHVYRSLDYIRSEATKLARQLADYQPA